MQQNELLTNAETLGARIKQRRDELGKTLQQIADAVGIAKSTVQRYENDAIGAPKAPVVSKIADALNVSEKWLMCQTDDMHEGEDEDFEFKYALFDEAAELTPENRAKLLEMAKFFKQQQEKDGH
ncbi:MAG: XRE family transcriptional regulator [Clostridia bacterium]|nr:XRE family transcriptional regulator [Clostridia bacterium]NLS85342.1 helix-turn-helix transcriptional regulator [Oscillospiraceae bacterium]